MHRNRLAIGLAPLVGAATTIAGCGGGGHGAAARGTEVNAAPRQAVNATARFHVDVKTGKVTVTPLNSKSRAIFDGAAVTFNSSVLVDQPGDSTQAGSLGRKQLSVTLTNNSGLTIGQAANGGSLGVAVVFSGFANVTTPPDLRPLVTVRNFAGTGVASCTDGPSASATFNGPIGVTNDPYGALFVTESDDVIRKISRGQVSTIAGQVGAAMEHNGPGTVAQFKAPTGIAFNTGYFGIAGDNGGALYIADYAGEMFRQIYTVYGASHVATVAGDGTDQELDGTSTLAEMAGPNGVWGNAGVQLLITDYDGATVRRYTGIVSTIAGTPNSPGFADGAVGVGKLNGPRGVTEDSNGNIYVADSINNRIRLLTTTGDLVTIAGTGAAGSTDGTGAAATFNNPYGIAYYQGALVVTENAGNVVRLVHLTDGGNPTSPSSWVVQTLAGQPGIAGNVNGTGAQARFTNPCFITIDQSGTAYLADGSNTIRQLVLNEVYQAGLGTATTPTQPVELSNATGVTARSASGSNLPYVVVPGPIGPNQTAPRSTWDFVIPSGVTAFEFNVQVEAAASFLAPPDASGVTRTFAGPAAGQTGFVDGSVAQALFNHPGAVAADGQGYVFSADTGNNAIRIANYSQVSTIGGVLGTGAGTGNGSGNVASFTSPAGITGNVNELFVTDSNEIRRLAFTPPPGVSRKPLDASQWTVTTIAGGSTAGTTNGNGSQNGMFTHPTAICEDTWGNLYVTEIGGTTQHTVRRIQFLGGDRSQASNWWVSLVAGGAQGFTNGTGAAAQFHNPAGVAVDAGGNVYIADSLNHVIRKITNAGAATTFAGNGTQGHVDGAAGTAEFDTPTGLTIDSSGYLYVTEASAANNDVRRVGPDGTVVTVAGSGAAGNVDGAVGVSKFSTSSGAGISPAGDLYIADTGNSSIRLIERVFSAGSPTGS